MVWIVIGLLLVFLLIILLCSKVYITFSLSYGKQKQITAIQLRLYGIRLFTKKVNLADLESSKQWEKQFSGKTINEKLKLVQHLLRDFLAIMHDTTMAVRIIIAKMTIHRLEWRSCIGTGDASTTGVATGGGWAIKGMVIGYLDHWSQLNCSPNLAVTPEFNRKYVFTKLDCMVSIRIGQAIHALIKVIRKSAIRKREVLI
ncbi:DUF2953 domain-containing protein [Lentibacillus sp. N15]|uniref:DUF2953 domain-containing protein n=1 Tax=Lentibacillus songyuanensis TaxID=3136161 RepID=UPI0031BAFC0A